MSAVLTSFTRIASFGGTISFTLPTNENALAVVFIYYFLMVESHKDTKIIPTELE